MYSHVLATIRDAIALAWALLLAPVRGSDGLLQLAAAVLRDLGLLQITLALLKRVGISFACCSPSVVDRYGALARRTAAGERDTVVMGRLAQAFGYSAEDLASAPGNQGLSCGNPVARASLSKEEVVVDLGCGAGFDVFLAAKLAKKAIGIDSSPDMIALAEASKATRKAVNVEFHLAPIERMPLDEGVAHCVISNCVLNLVADKCLALREVHRVLAPGGRLAISDIVKVGELPPDLPPEMEVLVSAGCIGGAITVQAYEHALAAAGFSHIEFVQKQCDMNVWKDRELLRDFLGGGFCCSGEDLAVDERTLDAIVTTLAAFDINHYVASYYVLALK